MQDLVSDGVLFVVCHARDGLEGDWVLGDERALDEEGKLLVEVVGACKFLDIANDLLFGQVCEWVLDPGLEC